MGLIGYLASPKIFLGLHKRLKANNRLIGKLPISPANTKQFKANQKAIKLIEDNYM